MQSRRRAVHRWSDEKGFVIQDGVILRTSEFEFYLTAGEPTLRYFKSIAREMQLEEVTVDDISEAYGILALQGPHAHNVISAGIEGLQPMLRLVHLHRRPTSRSVECSAETTLHCFAPADEPTEAEAASRAELEKRDEQIRSLQEQNKELESENWKMEEELAASSDEVSSLK